MTVRRSAWSVYDIFNAGDGGRVFVGVVSDSLWKRFCEEFGFDDWAANPELDTNNERVQHRDTLIPGIQARFDEMNKDEMMDRLDRAGVPFAPINKPIDLVDDPHMNAGALLDVKLNNGETIKLPAVPVEFDGVKAGLYRDLPAPGAGAREHLKALGLADELVESLIADGVMIAQ